MVVETKDLGLETREVMTEWYGVNASRVSNTNWDNARESLARASEEHNWGVVREVLGEYPQFINCPAYGSESLYTPLHHAADGNAPEGVIRTLVELGAWRTLETSDGERAVDIARRKNYAKLIELLQPEIYHDVPEDVLQSIQEKFHDVVRERLGASKLLDNFRLPQLCVLLENPDEIPRLDCAIPGFYGGFYSTLHGSGGNVKLVTESWSRVVGGSGQRHEITGDSTELVSKGFV
mmetsp:Transcript_646/g.776  ORF Transcript_646/g.776 Transcript_646/m.776 type:complete len:236 (+) Transcript_646:451-1158(+)|eukprot:CAMPEP_0204848648 /NCGR_PEP_ID=MMETSP1347-20130617/4655_1 /ASSEMBLY_ACC=CAM_ASM_000690 /TAXON_ID=215587 /ORGANISM="Aplanochytrium stocchinoi, Strain GSBS06" /LENGTH=235 /DNA_ID=CAMNT_0051990379 /DNA_START=214 /DNA_END=921 /DNA_ORIENTATION=-